MYDCSFSPRCVLKWYRIWGRNICMRGYLSGFSQVCRQLSFLMALNDLTCTLAEVWTSSSPSILNFSLSTYYVMIRLICIFTSVMELESSSHRINFLCFWRRKQAFTSRNILEKAFTTKFTGILNICRTFFIIGLFFCFVCIKNLSLDSACLNFYFRSSYGNIWVLDNRSVRAVFFVFISPGVS